MATNVRYWTRDDLEHLPDDGNRYEVLNGALLVTPPPSVDHQRIALRLAIILSEYCERYGIGWVVGPGAIVFGGNELLPDVHVIPGPYVPGRKWEQLPRAILVAEVRSDSTSRRDLGNKRAAYQAERIPVYWVVDGDARRALVWTPASAEPVTVTDTLRWQPRADIEPLEIPLDEVFPPRATN
ncbi:MAG TPA: Uma2 family endonuclease [Gemmatimonadaceae bacterium]|nr:Uma2 family endonuclease [Gemmatimonadaceae bacterium]